MYATNDARDVVGVLLALPRLGIADIVQMDAVDIVVLGNLLAHLGDVVGSQQHFRVHIALVAYLHDNLGVVLAQLLAAVRRPFADGYRHDPGM